MLPIRIYGFYIVLVILFFLSVSPASAYWFQTASGDIYSRGLIRMGTGVPAGFYLSVNYPNVGSSGIIIHNDTAPYTGEGTMNNAGEGILSWIVRRPVTAPLDYADAAGNYDAFFQSLTNKMFMENLPINEAIQNRRRGSYCPTQLPAGANKDYAYRVTGDITFDCASGNFNPLGSGGPPNRSIIIVVDGNVTIQDPIVFPNTRGAFFMLVATGTMTFADSIGGGFGNPSLRGVFVAPTIHTSDNALSATNSAPVLWGEGIFFALEEFDLNRRTAGPFGAAEVFIYKPSLMVSAPYALWDTFSQYQEIEP